MLTECGRCSAIWSPGSEEFDTQVCSACGWQMGDSIDDDDDDWIDDDDWGDPIANDDDDDDLIPYEPIS